ncbi:MAG: oligosaccharide flippase family protein, partial [Acidobacteriota bacterium]|nr:oligosaccharide flippase family protein [Acidobacteriota bacterium]
VLASTPTTAPAAGSEPRSLPLPLRLSFIWTLVGNLIYAGCQWIALIAIAKLGTPTMVGQFALATAISFPLTLVVNLQLRVLFLTDASRQFTLQAILGIRYIMAAAALVFLFVFSYWTRTSIAATDLILLIAAGQLVDCISDSYYGICQRYERNDRISQSLILRSCFSLIGLIIAIRFTGSLLLGAIGMLVSRLLVLALFDASRETFLLAADDGALWLRGIAESTLLGRMRPQWRPRLQLSMVWTSLPLGVVSVLVAFNANVPKYAIGQYLGARDVGIYSALSTLPIAGAMIANALGYSAFSRLSALYNAGNLHSYIRLTLKLLAVCAVVGGAGAVASAVAAKQVLLILYRPEYAEHSDLLVWLMSIGVVTYWASCLGVAMTAASRFRSQLLLFSTITLFSIFSCQLLVPRWGLQGAVVGSLVAALAQLAGAAFITLQAISAKENEMSTLSTSLVS